MKSLDQIGITDKVKGPNWWEEYIVPKKGESAENYFLVVLEILVTHYYWIKYQMIIKNFLYLK